jgi:hypothetical protein
VEGTYFLEFFSADQLVVVSFLDDLFWRSSGVTNLLLEDALILLQDGLDQGVFTDTGWTHEDEWLASEWRWVKRMEVFLRINVDIILERFELQVMKLTGLCNRTELRKSFRTSLISGWLMMYSSWLSISSSFLTERYCRTSLSKLTLLRSSD